jgi:hypothetical protein
MNRNIITQFLHLQNADLCDSCHSTDCQSRQRPQSKDDDMGYEDPKSQQRVDRLMTSREN